MRTIKNIFVCAVAGLLTATSSHGFRGPIAEKQYQPGEFNSIAVSAPAKVEWVRGTTHEVTVKTQEKQMDAITVEVIRGSLRIGTSGNFRGRAPIEIRVTSPGLTSVSVAGSGSFKTEENLEADKVDLSVSGSGSISAKVASDRVSANIAGSGNIYLKGRANAASYKISGSGNISAEELTAKAVNTEIAGSGTMHVHAVEQLNGRIAGSGVVRQGGPAVANVQVAGSGRVRRAD